MEGQSSVVADSSKMLSFTDTDMETSSSRRLEARWTSCYRASKKDRPTWLEDV